MVQYFTRFLQFWIDCPFVWLIEVKNSQQTYIEYWYDCVIIKYVFIIIYKKICFAFISKWKNFMNINKEYSDLNNAIEILTAPYKENIQAKEMDWIQ